MWKKQSKSGTLVLLRLRHVILALLKRLSVKSKSFWQKINSDKLVTESTQHFAENFATRYVEKKKKILLFGKIPTGFFNWKKGYPISQFLKEWKKIGPILIQKKLWIKFGAKFFNISKNKNLVIFGSKSNEKNSRNKYLIKFFRN